MIESAPLISLPVAVMSKKAFYYQASLFWFAHRQAYGKIATDRARILWILKNHPSDLEATTQADLEAMKAPYSICNPYYEVFDCKIDGVYVPLNIQAAVYQVIDRFDAEQPLEILDCDMFHMSPAKVPKLEDDELWVDPIYEDWHLHALSKNQQVISPYFRNGGEFFNGGFVPIIGKAKTIKKILPSWIETHIAINSRDLPTKVKWWAGMFALQVACENQQVLMRGLDCTYIPGKNLIKPEHHIAHYSVDKIFNKKAQGWPLTLDQNSFPSNQYYERISQWLNTLGVGVIDVKNSKSETSSKKDLKLHLPKKWKHWIAKSLTKNHTSDTIISDLLAKGYAESAVKSEIEKVVASPYFQGAKEVFDREIKKQSDIDFYKQKAISNFTWLLKTREKVAQLDENFGEIQRIPPPPFREFVEHYVSKNYPVILTDSISHWAPMKKWNIDYFRSVHGNSMVSIQDGREADPYFERNQKLHRAETRFSDFLDRLERTEKSNDFYMTAGNMSFHPEGLPDIFADCADLDIGDGYLNGPSGSLWIGPPGTITPLHFDMVNNLFCQISGRKRVRLVPSWSMPWVYNDYHVYSDVDVTAPDFEKHPLFKNATIFDFVVEPGEVLFIPVGWWHHLESLDITISLTRKNLKVKPTKPFGEGFVQESKYFSIGQTHL